MPSQTNDSNRSSTGPLPELNPLLNPLLGQHMGRWAEVYFTSPPDKRDAAVLELLRELQSQNSPDAEAVNSATAYEPTNSRAAAEPSWNALQPETIHCHTCDYENPSNRNYCGMCGTLLYRSDDLPLDNPVESAVPELKSEVGRRSNSSSQAPSKWPPPPRSSALSQSAGAQVTSKTNFGSFRQEPSSSSNRLYLAAGVTIALLCAGYFAWRPAPLHPKADRSTPPMSSGQSIQAPTPAPVQHAPSPSIEQLPGAEPLPSDRPPVQSARFASSQASTGTSLQPQASPEGGSEELAIAKTYLNGVSGHQVDSAQAAEWLWKATAKQNSEAPLLLSDLYLKGQGVEKNCDQAQVLLAAAARKGTKDAAERLRHLPAFGCQ